MGLKQRTLDEILEDSLDGTPPTHEELSQICDLAVTGHKDSQELEALKLAVAEADYFIVDSTTDDDDDLQLTLHPVQDDE